MRSSRAPETDEELIDHLRYAQARLAQLELRQEVTREECLGDIETSNELEIIQAEIQAARSRVALALDAAWDTICSRYQEKILRHAKRTFSNDPSEAEDYAQKLIYRMLLAIRGTTSKPGASPNPFMPNRGVSFYSYFFQRGRENSALSYAFADNRRKNVRHEQALALSLDAPRYQGDGELTTRGETIPSVSQTPLNTTISNEVLDHFIFTILSEREYLVVRLREVDGISVEDAAKIVGRHFSAGSPATVSGDHSKAQVKAIQHGVYDDFQDPLELVARRISEYDGA